MTFVRIIDPTIGPPYEVNRCYEMDDDLAAFYAGKKKVERVSFEAYQQATRGLKDQELRDSLIGEMRAVFSQMFEEKNKGDGEERGRPHPPNGGGAIDFGHIAAGNDPADKANAVLLRRIDEGKNKREPVGMGEVLGLIGIVGKSRFFSPHDVQFATRRLQGICGHATEQVFNETTGKWDYKSTRAMEGGGFETVVRTGTDSLAGGTGYGFAIKPEYLGNLFEISMEQQVFANAAQVVPVNQGVEVKWPSWDQFQAPTFANGMMQSAVFAGIQLAYESEAAPRVQTNALLNTIDFKIVDLTAATALSRDFVVDNYLAFDSALTRMIGRAFGWMEDYQTVQGPGIGRPQGYFNSPATLVVTRHSGSTITSNDLTAMIASASPMVWQDLRWITNITTIPQLAILANNAGTPVFQPNALITQAQQFSIMDKAVGGMGAELMHRPMGTLLGFPVYFSEKVPALGNQGDLSLVAPKQYGLAKRSGVEIAVSEHYYFMNDLIAYRMKLRHDGKSLWRAPYQQADGSATQVSPFVILS